jgi:predicted phage terminase large subunit-like protein
MDVIRPQPGPQELFLSSPADIAIYGGAAGGGKTWALLMDPLRHIHVPGFSAVLFRRTYPEIQSPGGMWPESQKLYPYLGARPNVTEKSWTFPSGCVVKFGHMQHEKDMQNWLGAQIAMIGFDQLERFTEDQAFYMLSRNRSVCGVRPYLRGTANPEPGWLADLLAWWIDDGTGYAIPERAGKVRWYVRRDNLIEWADTREELEARYPTLPPKSLTFIPARLEDNQALLQADPGYRANLLALPHIEQERLLAGNWKISSEEGEWPPAYFTPDIWFQDWPANLPLKAIALDPSKGKDAKFGDYRAYVWGGLDPDGMLWVDADLEREPTPRIVDNGIALFRRWSCQGFAVEINQFQELLGGEFIRLAREHRLPMPLFGINNCVNKDVRIRTLGPLLAQKQVRFKGGSRGAKLLVQQLQAFPNGDHDDGPDALEMLVRMLWHLIGQRTVNGQPTAMRG